MHAQIRQYNTRSSTFDSCALLFLCKKVRQSTFSGDDLARFVAVNDLEVLDCTLPQSHSFHYAQAVFAER